MTELLAATERLAAFRGEWSLIRVIRHADGGTARFRGTAVWETEVDGLICREVGTLTIAGGAPVTATRQTIWQATGDVIHVAFADGRPFHRIDLQHGSRITAAHDCPPDDYRLTYDFGLWPKWSVRWRVTGPRKDYRALSRYRRISR